LVQLFPRLRGGTGELTDHIEGCVLPTRIQQVCGSLLLHGPRYLRWLRHVAPAVGVEAGSSQRSHVALRADRRRHVATLVANPIRVGVSRDHPYDLTVLFDEADDLADGTTAGGGEHAERAVADGLELDRVTDFGSPWIHPDQSLVHHEDTRFAASTTIDAGESLPRRIPRDDGRLGLRCSSDGFSNGTHQLLQRRRSL